MSEVLARMVSAFAAAIPADANENILSHELCDGMRAALEAIREPSRKMLDAGENIEGPCGEYTHGEPLGDYIAGNVWRAMIDEVLKS